ncbi:DNA-directed RNA polymerase subunit RPC12/RpoP [Enterococcus sp. PF1-24]|nr:MULTISPECIES: hypothetical protein [unclassified Enterococcus]MDH6364646.1 DNA-directed RNA polymerase subunit RPC12/RpoP [Enterococcus sp. PFB1-1]MDH6401747.1 DNA-directed RNA polymerase subunit RPC12/RpoP [Enterococcus sp. PF1-24]
MEEKCPQCADPLKRATEINSLIETEIIECEYCGYTCKIDPKMKRY